MPSISMHIRLLTSQNDILSLAFFVSSFFIHESIRLKIRFVRTIDHCASPEEAGRDVSGYTRRVRCVSQAGKGRVRV